jgi:hypothetical protein
VLSPRTYLPEVRAKKGPFEASSLLSCIISHIFCCPCHAKEESLPLRLGFFPQNDKQNFGKTRQKRLASGCTKSLKTPAIVTKTIHDILKNRLFKKKIVFLHF